MRKAKAFRDGANKTASPCFPKAINGHLATVPVEQLQRNITLQKILLLGKTVFSVRQKGVPPLLLPASVLQLPRCLARIYNLDFHDATLFELDSFKRCNCSRKSNSQKSNLLRKCGLLAHTSPTFLKNCWIKKLFNCLRLGASITIPIKKQESL